MNDTKKKKVGRPTKYKGQETLDKIEEYLDKVAAEETPLIDVRGNQTGVIGGCPTYTGLALYLGVCEDTIHDWASQPEKKAFSESLKRVKGKQHEYLIRNGLGDMTNALITKMMLSSNHGYADKTESKVEKKTIFDGDVLPIKIVKPDNRD